MRTMHRKIEVANPHRTNAAREKGRSMANHKNAKKTANGGGRKKSNPFKKKYMELLSKRRKGSRNPSGLGDVIGSPKDIATTGLSALGSAIATKQLPQMILGAGNSGPIGYALNAGVALAATWAAGSFIGRTAGAGAFAGGLVIILDRVLTDNFSELGPVLSLSGVGDATSYGKLGTVRDGYFFHPGLVDGNGNMITPQPVLDQAVQQVVAAYPQIAMPLMQAQSGRMGAARPGNLRPHMANSMMLSSRFQSRFNR